MTFKATFSTTLIVVIPIISIRSIICCEHGCQAREGIIHGKNGTISFPAGIIKEQQMNEADELQIIRRVVDGEIEAFEHLVLPKTSCRSSLWKPFAVSRISILREVDSPPGCS
jgi:hypothetical protein